MPMFWSRGGISVPNPGDKAVICDPGIYRDMPRAGAGHPKRLPAKRRIFRALQRWARGQTPFSDSEAVSEVAEQELDFMAAKKPDE